jgi:hypothetical protein
VSITPSFHTHELEDEAAPFRAPKGKNGPLKMAGWGLLVRDDDVPGGFAPTFPLTVSTLQPNTMLKYTIEIKRAAEPRCESAVVEQQKQEEAMEERRAKVRHNLLSTVCSV